jgi:flagellin-like protein
MLVRKYLLSGSRSDMNENRAVSPVIGTIMMVAVTVILASVGSVLVLDVGGGGQPPAPQISVSSELVEDGSEKTIAVKLEAGQSVSTDQLYVTGSVDLDIGGAPDSSTPANENYASSLETFTESAGNNPPQVGIGPEWDAGETIYLDPVGDAAGVTVRIYWNTQPVEGVNPGKIKGEDSYKIVEFTV